MGKYIYEIWDDCGADEDCFKPGNRFSLIYALSGITMLLLALNSCFMLCGACSYHVRGLTACCGGLCSCLNFAAIITTGVFRYNSWGKLSALCEGPTLYDDDADDFSKLGLLAGWLVGRLVGWLVGWLVGCYSCCCSCSCSCCCF